MTQGFSYDLASSANQSSYINSAILPCFCETAWNTTCAVTKKLENHTKQPSFSWLQQPVTWNSQDQTQLHWLKSNLNEKDESMHTELHWHIYYMRDCLKHNSHAWIFLYTWLSILHMSKIWGQGKYDKIENYIKDLGSHEQDIISRVQITWNNSQNKDLVFNSTYTMFVPQQAAVSYNWCLR